VSAFDPFLPLRSTRVEAEQSPKRRAAWRDSGASRQGISKAKRPDGKDTASGRCTHLLWEAKRI